MDIEEDGQTTQVEDDSTAEEIEEAKNLGWKAPAEWKGAPPKNGFKSAKTYLEHGREFLPVVQSQNAKLKEELAQSRRDLSDFKGEQAKKFQRLEQMSSAALTRQRQQLEEKFEAVKEAAVEVGDKDAYRKADKEGKKALDEFDEAVADKKDDAKPDNELKDNKPPKEVDDWVKANEWFETDDDMKAVAIRKHGELLNKHKDWSLERNLEEVRKYIVKRFPSEFAEEADEEEETEDKPERRGSRVEGGGSRMGGSQAKTAWSKIPDEAKKQGDRFIKDDGLFLVKGETVEKDLQKARERYAADYLEME